MNRIDVQAIVQLYKDQNLNGRLGHYLTFVCGWKADKSGFELKRCADILAVMLKDPQELDNIFSRNKEPGIETIYFKDIDLDKGVEMGYSRDYLFGLNDGFHLMSPRLSDERKQGAHDGRDVFCTLVECERAFTPLGYQAVSTVRY